MISINIGELLKHRAYISPNVEGYIGRKRYSFFDMNERANRFSHLFKEKGIRKGDLI